MQKGNSNWHTGARKMYLGDSKLTEYKFSSVQGESPWISAWSLSKTSSYNTDKVKPQQFHSLFLKLHLICNCFCHSSVSHSKRVRSVISSLLICVIRNAVWELKFSPIGINEAFADDFSKMETWTPASLENRQQVERTITLFPLQRKLLASEWDYTKLMWFLTDSKNIGFTCRQCNPAWAHWDGSVCWFGGMITFLFLVSCFDSISIFCGVICLIRFSRTSTSQLREAVCEHRAAGGGPTPSSWVHCETASWEKYD